MKTKVITRHTPVNYGSLLQSIATIKAIESLDHECRIIDYYNPKERGISGTWRVAKTYHKGLKLYIAFIINLLEKGYPQYKFKQYRNRLLKLTPQRLSADALREESADVFITGSDQVWGYMADGNYDPAYFLDFVKGDAKKIAYSASFGRTDFPADTLAEYNKMLAKYDDIAVREDSAADLLNDMGIANRGTVLDPVMLFGKSEWLKLAEPISLKEKFVLVYQLHNNPAMDAYAKEFARKAGLKLVRVSPTLNHIRRPGKFVFLPSLGEFISYFNNAEYIVTDSFHGTCLSMLLNKRFIDIMPSNKTGTRITSILKMTGLDHRLINNMSDFSLIDKEIDYTQVNNTISALRAQSLATLKAMIEQR